MGELQPFGLYLDIIVEEAKRNSKRPDDYTGEDGLVYCGKCRTRKQNRIDWYDGTKKIVPVACKCCSEQQEREKSKKRIDELIKWSMIEPKYLKYNFENIEVNEINQRAVKICKRYVDKFHELFEQNQGMMFYGDTGTGKTVMAHCVANELMKRFNSVSSLSLAKVLKSGFKSAEEETAIMNRVKSAKLLIIDDLGAERGTDYAQEFVYSVIDTRCNYEKPMIITTNLNLDDMQNCTDTKYKRIYERIIETCYPIEFRGVSWRMKNAAARYDKFTEMLGGSD